MVLGCCLWRREDWVQRGVDSFLAQDGLDLVLLDGRQFEDGADNLARGWAQMQRLALKGGYDALYVQCDDVIAPPGAWQALAEVEADIVYANVFRRHTDCHSQVYLRATARGHPWHSLDKDAGLARRMWNTDMKCKGGAHSCALIRRGVLEQTTLQAGFGEQADYVLATEANRRGWKQRARLDVRCGHIMPNQKVVWPDIDAAGLRRILRRGTELPDLLSSWRLGVAI